MALLPRVNAKRIGDALAAFAARAAPESRWVLVVLLKKPAGTRPSGCLCRPT
jgi:hypothetical protein